MEAGLDRLTGMQVFVRVVDSGGFAQAARDLGLSRAMVSKHVQALEDRLGARLLNRTTRRISLTEVGAAFYDRCAQLLPEIEEAERAASAAQSRPQGNLRLNAPMSFGFLHLARAIADYAVTCPEVTIEITLNDRIVDLVEEGYDLALRIGRLTDSSLIARRLAPCRLAVCASPGYLRRRGTPRHPADLADHDCLLYSLAARPDVWRFVGDDSTGGGEVAVTVQGRFQANNGDVMRVLALEGQGIVCQPTFLIGEDLKAGRLVPLLPGYAPLEMGIHAVYPHSRHIPAKVRSFVDFLARRWGGEPEWDDWRKNSAEIR